MFNYFRIHGRTRAALYFGSTTLKVVEKAIRSISNGADRAQANGAARMHAGGSDPILEALMAPRGRETPLIGADLVTLVTAVARARPAIADTTTKAGGGMQRAQHRLSECAKQRSPRESSAMAFATSLSATWFRLTTQAGMICEWPRDSPAGLVPQLELPILLLRRFGQRSSPFGTSQLPPIDCGVVCLCRPFGRMPVRNSTCRKRSFPYVALAGPQSAFFRSLSTS